MSIALVAIIAIVLITLIVSFSHPLKISSSSISQDRVGAVTALYDDNDIGGGYDGKGRTSSPPTAIKSLADCRPYGICDVNDDGILDSADIELILDSLINESNACSGNKKAVCDLNRDGQVTVADLELLSAVLPSAKDMTLYQDKEVFIISSRDWRSIVSLVPVTTWTGNESCRRIPNAPNTTCAYPTLILYDETTSTNTTGPFDADTIIYFLQQYHPSKVTLVGPTPQSFDNLLIAQAPTGAGITANQIKRINVTDYLAYWANAPVIVYAKNDYAHALVASSYAALIDEPLIIQGGPLDNPLFFVGKMVACVGITDSRCTENYTIESLQQLYIKFTGTDKIILINPDDLTIAKSQSFKPSTSSTSLTKVFTKNSLAAPFLAAAKQELILPINSTDYRVISNAIKKLVRFNMYDVNGKMYMYNNGAGLLRDLNNTQQIALYQLNVSTYGKKIPARAALGDKIYDDEKPIAFWYYGTPLILHNDSIMWSEGAHRLMRYNPTTTETTILKASDDYDASIGPITPDYYSSMIAYYTIGYVPNYNYTVYVYDTGISNASLARKAITSFIRSDYTYNFQQYVDISNKVLAWMQPITGSKTVCDIYTYDLNLPNPVKQYELTTACGAVLIYGNKLVFRNAASEVFVYDRNSRTNITIPNAKQYSKKIVDGKMAIIGSGTPTTMYDIYLYNLLDNTKVLIRPNIVNDNLITNYVNAQNRYNIMPTLYKDYVTWLEYDNGGRTGTCAKNTLLSCTSNDGVNNNGINGGCSVSSAGVNRDVGPCQPPLVNQYRISTKDLLIKIDTGIRPNPPPPPYSPGIVPRHGIASQPISDGKNFYYQLNRNNNYYVNGYLTIIAAPNAIPSQEYFDLLPPYDNARALDQTEYADVFLNDRYPDLATGRIQGATISDVSTYVARDLFTQDIKTTNAVKFLAGGFDYGIYLASNWTKSFKDAGYPVSCNVVPTSTTKETPGCTRDNDTTGFDASWSPEFKNKQMTSYFGHGNDYFAGVSSSNLPNLEPALVFSDACSNCASTNPLTFCNMALRKGALLHAGTLSISWTGTKLPHDIMEGMYNKNMTMGQATAMNYDTGMFRHMWTVNGDPTITIQPTPPVGMLKWE